MTQARKIIDVPLVDVAPSEVQSRLSSEEFLHLLQEHDERKAAWEAAKAKNIVSGADVLRAFDAYKVAQHRLEAYKDATAALLPSREVTERDFLLPEGVERLGEAVPGTSAWLSMRQATLGGSDVGAICKVGAYGQMNYDDVRASKTSPSPSDQEHSGAALRGDLWEPWLISITETLTGSPVWANKGTFTDGRRHVNLDGFTLGQDGRVARVIEAKTSSHPEDWEESVPDGYALQTEHYGDFLGVEEPALLVANLNDQRLVIWEVPVDHQVPAGKNSPKKLGSAFSYSDVRGYAESMVAKWVEDAKTSPPRSRRGFQDTPEVRASWRSALSRGIVLADLETTGLSPDKGHIIEVALVRVQEGREVERFHRFYGVPAEHAEWNGTGPEEVHRISLEEIAGCPVLIESPEEVRAIRDFIGESILVAHNAAFEDRWLTFNGVSVPCADTMKAFGIAVRDEGIESNKMSSLMQWAGFEYRDAHRAINDVLMMLQALPALTERVEAWLARDAGSVAA